MNSEEWKSFASDQLNGPAVGFYRQVDFAIREFPMKDKDYTVGIRVDMASNLKAEDQVILSGARIVRTAFGWSVYDTFVALVVNKTKFEQCFERTPNVL